VELPKSRFEDLGVDPTCYGTVVIPTPTSVTWGSPGTDDTYNTIHRKQADGLYYQGIDKGVYNTIHQKNAGDLYYQGTSEARPTETATAPDTQLLLQQQQLRQCNSATQRRTTTPPGLAQPVSPGPWGPQDEEFEQEAWSSILDYVPGIPHQKKPPRKNKSPGEQAERAQKTTAAEQATGQSPTAQPPLPEAPEATNTTAPTRGVLRGLSPLAAGAARAIPQATHVPVKHGDGVYYQKAAPPGSEHEAKRMHDSSVPTKTTLDNHNNYDDYLPEPGPAFEAQPPPALLVPPGGRAPRHRGLHPDQDAFEDAYPTGEAHGQPHEARGDPQGTAKDEAEEPDWSRDSQDEADEGKEDDTANHDMSEPPRGTWGSERPAEPDGAPPPRPTSNYGSREDLSAEETRTERNRRARAEWREWRRQQRRRGLAPGYFYPSGAEQWKRRT
ncbi:unnamed protein product, partial [Symbiodinium sp. KB8]